MSIIDFLLVHVLVISITLFSSAHILVRRGLFGWLNAGFWAWFAFVLYFLLPPLYAIGSRNYTSYEVELSFSGGIERGIWIMFVLVLGISIFFAAYVTTKPYAPTWRLLSHSASKDPSIVPVIFLFFFAVGTYYLLQTRGAFFKSERELIIEGGRFVGQMSGYEYVAHLFLVVPILNLALSKNSSISFFGILYGVFYVSINSLGAWGRYTVVSMIIAISLSRLIPKKMKWPKPIWILAAVFMGLLLQSRGHSRFEGNEGFWSVLNSVPSNVDILFSGGDTAMLRTLYIESYVNDSLVGFDYGIPTINYLLFGFLPSSIFPDKYFMVDWLQTQQEPLNERFLLARLAGAKSSLVGSFYGHAGIIGVAVFMGLAGVLSRKLDGFVEGGVPLLVRSTGVAWMSILWMVWGSNDAWALMALGVLAMPTIAIWIFSSKQPNGINRRYGTRAALSSNTSSGNKDPR